MTVIASLDPTLKAVVNEAFKQGWRVRLRKKGGFIIYPPDRQVSPVAIPTTMRDPRGLENKLAEVRRAGLEDV